MNEKIKRLNEKNEMSQTTLNNYKKLNEDLMVKLNFYTDK